MPHPHQDTGLTAQRTSRHRRPRIHRWSGLARAVRGRERADRCRVAARRDRGPAPAAGQPGSDPTSQRHPDGPLRHQRRRRLPASAPLVPRLEHESPTYRRTNHRVRRQRDRQPSGAPPDRPTSRAVATARPPHATNPELTGPWRKISIGVCGVLSGWTHVEDELILR